ncbi:MAG: EscU/YscU/HrcU family type III secretion system export apparatus switch protein [Methylococcaceae bacterium]|nr:EscU/YscU/HrcU family type III secretion system export apparatus switch protein [Methylococcaceae bacterium]
MKDVNTPPRIAIALHYDKKIAPRVTAKGKGQAAEQILKIAEQHDIPLQEDAELARLLGTIPLGSEIPTELYQAVAEVIAFTYLLGGRNA